MVRGALSRMSGRGWRRSASISSRVRNDTSARSNRLAGMASTRAMCLAGWGWRKAANLNKARMAVSRASAVRRWRPVSLQVFQEGADTGCVEVLEVQLVRPPAAPGAGEDDQHPQGVAVGGDRVRAGLGPADEPVGEERLQGGGERAHGSSPRVWPGLPAATASSSGAAEQNGPSSSRTGQRGPCRPTGRAAGRPRRRLQKPVEQGGDGERMTKRIRPKPAARPGLP